MRFLHVADIHLGCRRYNLDERVRDFFRAWRDVIERHAIAKNVDFVLIAGDFFNQRVVDPQTMNHAIVSLEMLKRAGIPVVAIEGNHDQHEPDFKQRSFTWLRSLAQWGHLVLLEPMLDQEGKVEMRRWDEKKKEGSYIDIKDARIFGSYWYGMTATQAIPALCEAIAPVRTDDKFNVLMLHTDVEGQMSRPIPAVSVATLKQLRTLVEYVALGHTHKRFELENWAFNPGSLEAVAIDEYREERGVYLVEVEKVEGRYETRAEHLSDHLQRPFQRLTFDVSGSEDADHVHAEAIETVKREAKPYKSDSAKPAPIVEITLRGHLGFKNSLLDLNKLRDETRELTNALHVIVKNQTVPVEYAASAGVDAQLPRQERERRIIENLVTQDVRFRDRAASIAALVIEAKRLALTDEDPSKIVTLIEQKLDAAQTEDIKLPDAPVRDVESIDEHLPIAVSDEEIANINIETSAKARRAIERNATSSD